MAKKTPEQLAAQRLRAQRRKEAKAAGTYVPGRRTSDLPTARGGRDTQPRIKTENDIGPQHWNREAGARTNHRSALEMLEELEILIDQQWTPSPDDNYHLAKIAYSLHQALLSADRIMQNNKLPDRRKRKYHRYGQKLLR
jgi:hypothetical protein